MRPEPATSPACGGPALGQASIAKLERRTDMYLSILRRFVETMGGELEIIVRFPDQPDVRLRGIGELNETEAP